MLEETDSKAGLASLPAVAIGRRISQLVINLHEGGVCEMLISGDEGALRVALLKNLAKITAMLRT